ncbi:hypothetical protein ZHAS_00016447 [Anopheles sinensis]|uniref:Uncharacterized protein n=1 Tax=Anopheles sinensis TaxID=74873 RepID=A0A084WE19_ANOSI|nr:hypothetical protein ZHAS_00016447 [Anopheles sinensis]
MFRKVLPPFVVRLRLTRASGHQSPSADRHPSRKKDVQRPGFISLPESPDIVRLCCLFPVGKKLSCGMLNNVIKHATLAHYRDPGPIYGFTNISNYRSYPRSLSVNPVPRGQDCPTQSQSWWE